MMLKFLILVTVLVIMCIWLGPQTLQAQQQVDQEWKTYINPELGFQIDYPYMSYTYIFEHKTLPSALITGDYSVMIDVIKLNHTLNETEQFANKTIENHINAFGGETFQDIHPVKYGNMSGLSATLFNKNITGDDIRITKFVFLNHDDRIYQFLLEDFNKNFHGDEFDKMVNTVKFFD